MLLDLLGWFFVGSGALKLFSHRHFTRHAIRLGVAPANAWGKLGVATLIGIELLMGVLMLARVRPSYVLAAMLLLLTGLTVMVVFLIRNGKAGEDCGCYGSFHQEKLNAHKVISNLIWVALIIVAIFLPKDQPTLASVFLALLLTITRLALLKISQFFASFTQIKERL